MEKVNNKSLTKKEIFICEIIWGGTPTDINFVRNSKLFHAKMDDFENYKELFMSEQIKKTEA